jgi:hypothetical protein
MARPKRDTPLVKFGREREGNGFHHVPNALLLFPVVSSHNFFLLFFHTRQLPTYQPWRRHRGPRALFDSRPSRQSRATIWSRDLEHIPSRSNSVALRRISVTQSVHRPNFPSSFFCTSVSLRETNLEAQEEESIEGEDKSRDLEPT